MGLPRTIARGSISNMNSLVESPAAREEAARREELAAFLRSRREALQPEDIGIPRRGRRRVKGLRRHEVADIAAVSVTWYTWMEQGRDIRTTPQVIDALARALMLDADGHRHLRRLAGVPMTKPEAGRLLQNDGRLKQLVDDLLPHPAHLMEPVTDLIAWNRAYARLFADPERLEPRHRNGLWIQLMTDEVRSRLVDWETDTEHAVARFRAEAGKYLGDPRFAEVIDELNESSVFFRDAWQRHVVEGFAAHTETVDHPEVGRVRARIVQLRPIDQPHLVLMVHELADAESRARMSRLLGELAPTSNDAPAA